MSTNSFLLPYEPEIEKTCKRLRREQRLKKQQAKIQKEKEREHFNKMAENVMPNPIHMADQRDRAMRDYAATILEDLNSSVMNPVPTDAQFEFKPMMLQMLNTIGQFGGPEHEDPRSHLKSFIKVANTFRLPGISDDALRLTLFLFSLLGQAIAWLNAFLSDTITTWSDMVDKFLVKYFPPTRNADVREEIISFRQKKNEAVNVAWERFKDLIRNCPNIRILACVQIEHFFRGCDIPTKMMLNGAANGKFTSKSFNKIVEILDQLSEHNDQWCSERSRTQSKRADPTGVPALDNMTSMQKQIDTITQMLKNIEKNNAAAASAPATTNPSPVYEIAEFTCYYCADLHPSENCPSNPCFMYYVGQMNQQKFNPYSNTYNLGWKQHPNFS
ncbi:uncharacterized protein LOC111025516 [Momordica charantia]|uniref:Uncharacterized protein LOC111025516 n=1 Tax=Momordica charantia TaxID=3673 RepID=A0A6J1E1A9_MOMCH|nr:uncharacterized protein LOC111025516 [Momordica charantia]